MLHQLLYEHSSNPIVFIRKFFLDLFIFCIEGAKADIVLIYKFCLYCLRANIVDKKLFLFDTVFPWNL